MLKVEHPIDYLKEENTSLEAAEPLEGAQHVKQIASRQKIHRFKRSDDNPELPENFKVGQAIGAGDCFFDSVAQGLKQLKPDMGFTVKSLHKVCKDLAIGDQQLKSRIVKDAKNCHDPTTIVPDSSVNDDELWKAYLARIEYTSDDINKMRDDDPSLYQSLTSSKYGSTLQVPIWGRPDIEGQMICKKYNVKLHVVEKRVVEGKEVWLDQIVDGEGSRSVDRVDYNKENTIHIINRGAHFEPILDTQKTQHNKQQSDLDIAKHLNKQDIVQILERHIEPNQQVPVEEQPASQQQLSQIQFQHEKPPDKQLEHKVGQVSQHLGQNVNQVMRPII